MKPSTPTIGTATDGGTGTTVSVAFTPSTYIGKGTISYTATSSPGGLTGTGSASPITVSGLTTGTAYTFTVVGTTNYGVSSNASAASNSVTPASPSSYESIATATGTGSSATITFSSIPGTYKHLQIRLISKDDDTSGSGSAGLSIRFNSDTGSNYAYHRLYTDGSTIYATGSANTTFGILNNACAGNASGIANMMGVGIVDIHDYASTSKTKTVRNFSGGDFNGSGGVGLGSTLWNSTSAITSISIIAPGTTNFTTSSTFALYGIKG